MQKELQYFTQMQNICVKNKNMYIFGNGRKGKTTLIRNILQNNKNSKIKCIVKNRYGYNDEKQNYTDFTNRVYGDLDGEIRRELLCEIPQKNAEYNQLIVFDNCFYSSSFQELREMTKPLFIISVLIPESFQQDLHYLNEPAFYLFLLKMQNYDISILYHQLFTIYNFPHNVSLQQFAMFYNDLCDYECLVVEINSKDTLPLLYKYKAAT